MQLDLHNKMNLWNILSEMVKGLLKIALLVLARVETSHNSCKQSCKKKKCVNTYVATINFADVNQIVL